MIKRNHKKHYFLANLSTKCSEWAVITGLCPWACRACLNIFTNTISPTKPLRQYWWKLFKSCSKNCILLVAMATETKKIFSGTARPRAWIFELNNLADNFKVQTMPLGSKLAQPRWQMCFPYMFIVKTFKIFPERLRPLTYGIKHHLVDLY